MEVETAIRPSPGHPRKFDQTPRNKCNDTIRQWVILPNETSKKTSGIR